MMKITHSDTRTESVLDVHEETAYQRIWTDDELSAALGRVLDTPVQFDLCGTRHCPGRNAQYEDFCLLTSLRQVLLHPSPPLHLLVMTKEYAKAHRYSPLETLPPQVATVLYFAAIAAASVHCRRKITTLLCRDQSLGYRWCLGQSWIDTSLAELVREADACPMQHTTRGENR